MLEAFTLENAIKLSTPVAKKLFDEKVKPIVSSTVSQYFKNRSDKNLFEKESVKYISRSTGQCSTINTIAFPNTPKKLEELYIPLKVIDEKQNKITIDSEADIFEIHSKVLVNDTAGMGKSTLSKRVFLNILQQQNYIPVFIELRQLEKQPIAHQIISKFGVTTENPSKFLNQLPLVYILDGLDEVSVNDKNYIIKEIRAFIDQLDDVKMLITSRQESYLSEFYDFTRYTIQPLVEEEAFSLISKYDPKGEVAKKLIEGIKRSSDRGLKEFMSTPLYVSLLFCAYRHKTVIPQKKHLFYSQVYEALFESHDLSKEVNFVRPKHSKLDSSEFHVLLRRLGFWCLKNGGKIEFQKDELEIIVQDIISSTNGVETSAVNFVKDLTTTVPLFLKEGSCLRWSHKSLMEYFSAMFICNDAKDKQQNLLLYFYQSKEWSTYKNIFSLCADIDFSALRASVVKKLLESFINYHGKSYKNIKNKRIKPFYIEERIGLSFGREFGFRVAKIDLLKINDESFWGEDNPDVKAVKNMCKDGDVEVSQMITSGPKEHFIYGVSAESRERMIVNILKYKSPELFLGKDKSETNFDSITSIQDSAIKYNKLYIVLDNPTALINNSKHFHIINDLLRKLGNVAFDYNKAKIELSKINEDSSNGIDLLIGDLGGGS